MAQNDYHGILHPPLISPKHSRSTTHHHHAKEQFGVGVEQQPRPQRIKSPSKSPELNSPLMFQQQSKCSQRVARGKNQSNWASGGPGMQAVFLGSGPRSCGTGVFLPRREGTDFQYTNKPVFSPVLLPARVVQTLNLNVHKLGHQIKSKPDQNKNIVRKNDEKLEKKKKADDAICLSPDIFLPKEWTY
ncbi:hypothetical protein Salat_2239100 [Sesamum alatum]|uniref:Uncharacterized protein n=1 Tax=Sesamum alatum TaxID=300844 RepID=A0AAE2CDL4_9LAMI|nr:hypothetical protein Salat_2239100 [Sesamum alatum]